MKLPGDGSTARTAEDLTGATVGRYVISARLGAGNMGEVYLAQHTQLRHHVAIKRLAPKLRADARYLARFLREGQRASALNHPHIARVYDVLEEKGELLLVMEYVEGTTLRERLKQAMGTEEFLETAIQCGEALAAAHQTGILHGDIKPDNIMLTPEHQVKVLDFGVARRLPFFDENAETQSLEGAISGTPAYMAPEVLLLRQADARADIFSLGVVFYEALSGRHPFLAEGFTATTDRILHEEPPPLSRIDRDVPEALSGIVAKALAKNPAARYASAAQVVSDLRAVQRGEQPVPRIPYRLRAAGLAALMLVLVVAGVPSLRQRLKTWIVQLTSGQRVEAAIPPQKNLAVLPFTVVGGDSALTAFGTGLAATLNGKLTQLTEDRSLQVIPASEMRDRGVTTLEQARQEFGVNLGLRITLDRSAEMIRVTYSLIDAKTSRQLRGKTITESMSDVFVIEDSVADNVVKSLEIELPPKERQALDFHGTTQPAAYDYYLQGRGYLQDYQKPENINSAITVLNHALELDKTYAPAYAGLGEAYWRKYQHSKENEWVGQAVESCKRAVALADQQGDGHACLGLVYNGTGDYEHAVEQFQLALKLEPTNDGACRGLASAYEHLGKFAEAERTYREAIRLRPHYWAGYSWLGGFFYRQGRYREAGKMWEHSLALAPDSFVGYNNLGLAYLYQGRYDEAITNFKRSIAVRSTAPATSNLAMAYFNARQFAESARTYEEAIKLDDRNSVVWGNLGDAYYWTPGRRAEAVGAYQKAISLTTGELQVNPRDASLLGYIAVYYAMLAKKEPALKSLEKALRLAPDDAELRFNAALVHYQLGQKDQALSWLDKALAAGFSQTTLRDTPNFDNLRADRRFQDLIKKY